MDKNYVIKIESLKILSNAKLINYGHEKLMTLRQKLSTYAVDTSYKTYLTRDEDFQRFDRFLTLLDLKFDSASIEIYISFLFGSPSMQNVPEYLNYLALKDTELNEFITSSLGIIFTRHYSIIVQEKGITTEERSSAKDDEARDFFINTIKPKFSKSGYILKDIHEDNLIIAKNGKAKICDTGCCTLNEFQVSNY